ncbi:hypothetical protein NHJ13051_002042 [Beauveria bassiana]
MDIVSSLLVACAWRCLALRKTPYHGPVSKLGNKSKEEGVGGVTGVSIPPPLGPVASVEPRDVPQKIEERN